MRVVGEAVAKNSMQVSLVYTGGPSAGSRVSFPLKSASIGCLGLVALDDEVRAALVD